MVESTGDRYRSIWYHKMKLGAVAIVAATAATYGVEAVVDDGLPNHRTAVIDIAIADLALAVDPAVAHLLTPRPPRRNGTTE